MNGRFFGHQVPTFARENRAIALDWRGHGRSSQVHTGHTLPQYAQDLQHFIQKLKLTDVVLVGWSMGALVMREYLKTFGLGTSKRRQWSTRSPPTSNGRTGLWGCSTFRRSAKR
jgi:pimeloyl-ACP methyl ester carboxylesterase